MTVNISLFAGVGAQFFDNNGTILSGGLVYTYAAGTTTPQAAYTTSAGTIAHTNPIVLDSAGRVSSGGEIWLTDPEAYKFVLKTSAAVTIATYDNVTGNSSGIYAAFAASNGASLVGYTQGSTGSVTTTVQSKLREIVSVKDFGAVGDGVTDDTTAFQSAVNSLSSVGGTVFVPSGSYLIGQISWVKDGVTIAGDAVSGSRLALKNNVNDSMFKIGDGGTTSIGNTTIKNLYLSGNKANQTAGHGVYSWGNVLTSVIDCNIVNFKQAGIYATNGAGVDYYGRASGNYITGCDLAGIYLTGGVYSYGILGNVISGCGKSPANGAGIFINANDTHRILGNLFDENENGITLSAASDITIVGNQFENQDRSSVLLFAGSTRNVISGNSILNSGLELTDTYFGVKLDDSYYNVTTGNMIINSSATKMSDGVRETGASDYNVVSGNTINNAIVAVRLLGVNSRKVGNTGQDAGFTNVLVNSPTGIGYGTGAGGAVTQLTDKSTAVTLNTPTGQIRTQGAALAGGTAITFSFNNSTIAASDVVVCGFGSNAASLASYNVWTGSTTTGQCEICLKNISVGSLSEEVDIRFTVIKGAIS